MSSEWFEECEFSDEMIGNLVRLFLGLRQRVDDENGVIREILEGDAVRITRLERRLSK
jgi:hypothetical protein